MLLVQRETHLRLGVCRNHDFTKATIFFFPTSALTTAYHLNSNKLAFAGCFDNGDHLHFSLKDELKFMNYQRREYDAATNH